MIVKKGQFLFLIVDNKSRSLGVKVFASGGSSSSGPAGVYDSSDMRNYIHPLPNAYGPNGERIYYNTIRDAVRGFFSELDDNNSILRPDGSRATINSSDDNEVVLDYVNQLHGLGYFPNPENVDARQLYVLGRTITYLTENNWLDSSKPLSDQENALNLIRNALLGVVSSPYSEQGEIHMPLNIGLPHVIPSLLPPASSQREGIIPQAQNLYSTGPDGEFVFDVFANPENEPEIQIEQYEEENPMNSAAFGTRPGLGLVRAQSESTLNLPSPKLPALKAKASGSLVSNSRRSTPHGSTSATPRASNNSARPDSTPGTPRDPGSPVVDALKAAAAASVSGLDHQNLGDILLSGAKKVGNFVGSVLGTRNQKTPQEYAEEGFSPNLAKTRDNLNGFAKLTATIVSFIAANQVISILSTPFKWIKLDLLFNKGGLVFSVFSYLNEFFIPSGQRIFSDVFRAQVLNGKFHLEIGQGLYILLAAFFNLFFIALVVYFVYLAFGWFYERWIHRDDFKKIEENKKILRNLLDNEKK